MEMFYILVAIFFASCTLTMVAMWPFSQMFERDETIAGVAVIIFTVTFIFFVKVILL